MAGMYPVPVKRSKSRVVGVRRIPNTNIAVDYWGVQPSLKHYFLTHMHADHHEGLHAAWSAGRIYCSEVTQRLLVRRLGVDPAIITVLEVGRPTQVFLDREQTVSIEVTALDANHCPGAVMYLMRGYFGTVLHTGDFRYDPSVFDSGLLAGVSPIDMVYVDNTYCHPRFVFPARAEAIEQIVAIIEAHRDHRVLVGLDTLGKEELLLALAQRFRSPVVVSQSRLDDLALMGLELEHFTTDPARGFIHAVHKREVTAKIVAERNQAEPTIGIQPTGWAARATHQPQQRSGGKVFCVPYSLHSSFAELEEFVSRLRPRRLAPITSLPHDVMRHLGRHLDPTPSAPFDTPASIYSASKGPSLPDETWPEDLLDCRFVQDHRPISASGAHAGNALEPEVDADDDDESRPRDAPIVISDDDSDTDSLAAPEECPPPLEAADDPIDLDALVPPRADEPPMPPDEAWRRRSKSLVAQFYPEVDGSQLDTRLLPRPEDVGQFCAQLDVLIQTSPDTKKTPLHAYVPGVGPPPGVVAANVDRAATRQRRIADRDNRDAARRERRERAAAARLRALESDRTVAGEARRLRARAAAAAADAGRATPPAAPTPSDAGVGGVSPAAADRPVVSTAANAAAVVLDDSPPDVALVPAVSSARSSAVAVSRRRSRSEDDDDVTATVVRRRALAAQSAVEPAAAALRPVTTSDETTPRRLTVAEEARLLRKSVVRADSALVARDVGIPRAAVTSGAVPRSTRPRPVRPAPDPNAVVLELE